LEQVTGKTLEAHHVKIDEAKAGKVSRPPSPLPAEKQ